VKLSRAFRLGKEFSYTAATQVVNGIGLLLVLKITASRLEPSEYGNLALILTLAGLINKLGFGGIINAVSRFYPIAEHAKSEQAFLQSVRSILTRIGSALAVILGFIVIYLFITNDAGRLSEIVALFAFAACNGLSIMVKAIHSAQRDRQSVFQFSVINYISRILTVFILIDYFGPYSISVIIAYSVASLATAIFQIRKLTYQLDSLKFGRAYEEHNSSKTQWVWELWRYAWPFSIWGIFTWLEEAAGKWSLQAYFGPSDVGYFTIGMQLGVMPILLVAATVNQFVSPVINKRLAKVTDQSIDWLKKSIYQISFGWIIFIICSAYLATQVHGTVYGLMTDSLYTESSYLLPYFVVVGGLQALLTSTTMQLNALKISKPRLVVNITCSLVSALITFLGARFAGIYGVIISLWIGYTIRILWNLYLGNNYSTLIKIHSKQQMGI